MRKTTQPVLDRITGVLSGSALTPFLRTGFSATRSASSSANSSSASLADHSQASPQFRRIRTAFFISIFTVAFLVLLGRLSSDDGSGRMARTWRPLGSHNGHAATSAQNQKDWGKPVDSADYRDLPQQSAGCNNALNIPRVALLFLTRFDIFHEATWADWFKGASGLVPKTALRQQGGGCSDKAVRSYCRVDAKAPLLEQQFLFNVYAHPSPGFEGFSADSIFHGHAIPDRLETTWNSYNMTDAVRLMMRHALRDPLAQYFAVLSDTGVPLYPPTVVYTQLMAETRSRINACAEGAGTGRGPGQWEWQQPLSEVKGLTRVTWRKSMQPVGLKRRHVEEVVRDEKVIASFRRHCRSWFDAKGYHQCKVDEHYMATLLSLRGLDKETDCKGYLVSSDWSLKGRHPGGPHEWDILEINATLFQSIRQSLDWGQHFGKVRFAICRAEEAVDLADSAFVDVRRVVGDGDCLDLLGGSHTVLTQDCALFARKFPVETAAVVHDTLRNTTHALRIIPYS